MNLIKLICGLPCIFLVGFSMGCSKPKINASANPVLEAYRLIDEQRTDEAILLMEDSIQKDPENVEYKTTLASAYAQKAGVTMKKLLSVFKLVEHLKLVVDKYFELTETSEASSSVSDELIVATRFISYLGDVVDSLLNLPALSSDQLVYLNHAVLILGDLKAGTRQEDIVYRVVLKVILMKNYLVQNLKLSDSKGKLKSIDDCQFDASASIEIMDNLEDMSLDIFSDVAKVQTDKSEVMKDLLLKVKKGFQNLKKSLKETGAIDKIKSATLLNAAQQLGFQGLAKCATH